MLAVDHFSGVGPNRAFVDKRVRERAVICVTCSLSLVGSLLIILSYVCFRSLRTRARLILVHISIMDFGVAASNLIGAAVYFDRFYQNPTCFDEGNVSISVEPHICPVTSAIHGLCVAQAFCAHFFTNGSILWTLGLSVYLYLLIVQHETQKAKRALYFCYFACYLAPMALTIWMLLSGRLGYSPYNSGGWCSIILKNPDNNQVNMFTTILAYDLWICLAIVLISTLSVSVHFYIRNQLKDVEHFYNSDRIWHALHNIDYKFLLIPIAFILLRIWSLVVDVTLIYVGVPVEQIPKTVAIIFVYLSGIGDSGQGLLNAILFVLFTKKVRDNFLFLLRWLFCCGLCQLWQRRRQRTSEGTFENPWEKKALVISAPRYSTPTPTPDYEIQ